MTSMIATLGWPHVSLLFAIIFIVIFYKPLKEFITRIKSVGKSGLDTEPMPKAQNEEARQKAVEELMKLGDSALLLEIENLILADLKARGLETNSDSTKVLTRHLAATQLALDFEQVYNSIFGSQISLLKRLNEVIGQGLGKDQMEEFFASIQEPYTEGLGAWILDDYLRFLFGHTLLTVSDGRYHITVKGVEFLVWLIKTGHSERRPL